MKKEEVNPTVEWKERRKKVLSCSYCKPNKGENTKRSCQFHKKNKSWKFKKLTKQFNPK